ncbi:cytochrome c biogenesis heme-transporting ATPase CcmA [Vibrio sp. WJH972]
MLDIKNLSVIRGNKPLISNLSFSVFPGELIQVEGQNGSGKTTLLRILAGLGVADEGDVYWNQSTIKRCRDEYNSELLFIGHQTGVKRELTALENAQFYQSLHNNTQSDEKIYTVLAKVGLAGREDIPVMHLSAGQQRRVALARLWLSEKKLWVLDEPLTAIDKKGVAILESLFTSHVERGGMLVFTTHQDLFRESNRLKSINLGEAPIC